MVQFNAFIILFCYSFSRHKFSLFYYSGKIKVTFFADILPCCFFFVVFVGRCKYDGNDDDVHDNIVPYICILRSMGCLSYRIMMNMFSRL